MSGHSSGAHSLAPELSTDGHRPVGRRSILVNRDPRRKVIRLQAGHAKRPLQGLPPDGEQDALRRAVHICPSPRQSAGDIRDRDPIDRSHPQQGGARSHSPASHTGALGIRRLGCSAHRGTDHKKSTPTRRRRQTSRAQCPSGYRFATRSAGWQAARSALPYRWPATVGSQAPPPEPTCSRRPLP